MPLTLDQLEDELLALPAENRERLAISLLDSLPESDEDSISKFSLQVPEFSLEQRNEFDRRSEELANGTVVGVPYEEAMARIDAILRQG